jgi:hypothetical protein
MRAAEIIAAVESVGGALALNGSRIHYDLPEQAEPLLDQIRASRDEVYQLLTGQRQVTNAPAPVRIPTWDLLPAPVAITNFSVVKEVDRFARSTLKQLRHALAGRNWLAGNWGVRDLVERLEKVGVKVRIETSTAIVDEGAHNA